MRLPYIREAAGLPTRQAQEARLRKAGVLPASGDVPLWIDKALQGRHQPRDNWPQLAAVVEKLGNGDQLVIAGASIIGGSVSAVMSVLQAVGSKGATVYDAEVKSVVAWHSDAADVLAFVQRAEVQTRAILAKNSREAKVAAGAIRGAPARLEGEALKAAHAFWLDLKLSAKEAATLSGVSESTMRRLFGSKGVAVAPKRVT